MGKKGWKFLLKIHNIRMRININKIILSEMSKVIPQIERDSFEKFQNNTDEIIKTRKGILDTASRGVEKLKNILGTNLVSYGIVENYDNPHSGPFFIKFKLRNDSQIFKIIKRITIIPEFNSSVNMVSNQKNTYIIAIKVPSVMQRDNMRENDEKILLKPVI
jgi:hypothetical protein